MYQVAGGRQKLLACPATRVSAASPGRAAMSESATVDVCNRALAKKKAEGAFPYPDFNPTRPDWVRYPGVARALASTPGLFRSWLKDIESLGEPATGQAAWDDFVAAIRDHVRIAAEQYRAAVRHDSATFTRDYEEGSDVQDKLLDAATGAGVSDCAAVDR
jgi:hypothetical protein